MADTPKKRSKIDFTNVRAEAGCLIREHRKTLAIGLDAKWPIAPAFLLGPLVMISAYIFLSLGSEANTTS